MKFLHLADLHIGKKVNGFPMLEDQKYIFGQVFDVIKNEKIDAVLMAGDIYDKPVPSAESVCFFDDLLTKLANLGLPVFVISGNHDSAERIGFGADILKTAGIYMSKAYDGHLQKISLDDEFGKINVYLLPFVKPANVRQVIRNEEKDLGAETKNLDDISAEEITENTQDISSYEDAFNYVISREEINTDERNIIISHQFVTGAIRSESEDVSVGGVDNIDVNNFEKFDYAALGHIHGCQHVGREEVRYAGTLLKYSFSEEKQDKVALIVDMKDKGDVSISKIPLNPLHDLKTVKGTFNEVTDREFYKSLNRNDYYRVILTDEEDIVNAIGRLKEVYPNIMTMEYDNTRTRTIADNSAAEISEDIDPLDYFKKFYEQQNGKQMTEEQSDFVAELIKEIWEDNK